jgi:hypothetical protein
MKSKILIVSVGAALVALLGDASDAANVPTGTPNGLLEVDEASVRGKLQNRVLNELMFRIGEEAHTLTLHKSSTGILFAGHGSHSSHGSHRSHRSGR